MLTDHACEGFNLPLLRVLPIALGLPDSSFWQEGPSPHVPRLPISSQENMTQWTASWTAWPMQVSARMKPLTFWLRTPSPRTMCDRRSLLNEDRITDVCTWQGFPLDSTPNKFDTQFYIETLLKGVTYPGNKTDSAEIMSPFPDKSRLPSDFAIARDPRYGFARLLCQLFCSLYENVQYIVPLARVGR